MELKKEGLRLCKGRDNQKEINHCNPYACVSKLI